MKKFIATAQVRNLAMSLFFLLGLMFVNTGSVSAQATLGGTSINWVTDGAAIAALKPKVVQLKQTDLLSQDAQTYATAEARYHFYLGIIESIEGGMGTEAAFYANLINITSQPAVNAAGFAAANTSTPVDAKAIQTATLTFLTY